MGNLLAKMFATGRPNDVYHLTTSYSIKLSTQFPLNFQEVEAFFHRTSKRSTQDTGCLQLFRASRPVQYIHEGFSPLQRKNKRQKNTTVRSVCFNLYQLL